MRPYLHRVLTDRRGATAIEYGLIAALIVLVMVGALETFAGKTVGTLNSVSSAIISVIG